MEPGMEDVRKREGELKCVPVQSLLVKTAFWPQRGTGLARSVSLACHSDS